MAIVGNPGGVWMGDDPWEWAVREVLIRRLGPQRRTRTGLFAAEEGIDTIRGELYSTSYANRALLGDRTDGFAADVRPALLALDPAGRFVQHRCTEYLIAYKR